MLKPIRTTILFGVTSGFTILLFSAATGAQVDAVPVLNYFICGNLIAYCTYLHTTARKSPVLLVYPAVLGLWLIGAVVNSTAFIVANLLILALVRSTICFTSTPGRSAVAEILLLLISLGLAQLIQAPTSVSLALCVWLFYLIQALYFCLVPMNSVSHRKPVVDRFEAAYQKVESLLRNY